MSVRSERPESQTTGPEVDGPRPAGERPAGVPATAGGVGAGTRVLQAFRGYVGVLGVLVLLVVVLSAVEPKFPTWVNFINIMETNAVTLVIAVGLTFVLLTGGFDLSVGGLLALAEVVMAKMLLGTGLPEWLVVVAVILLAGLVGLLVNGMLIAKVGLSFFVVTLGTATLFRGLAQLTTQGQTLGLYDQKLLKSLGTGTVGDVPYSVIISVLVLLLGIVVLRYTGFGRMVYAVGGNPEAARLAGINVAAVRLSVYTIVGLSAGLSAVLDASRILAAGPTARVSIELTAGAAVLLGGTSFIGGSGTLLGTLLGVLFLGVLSNGLTLTGVSPFWNGVITGLVLVLAVALDRLRTRNTPA